MEKICCSLASIKEGEDSKLKTFCTLRFLIVALEVFDVQEKIHDFMFIYGYITVKKLWRKTLLLGTHTFISPYTPHYVRLEFQMIEKCDLSVLAFTISDFIVDYQI